MKTEPFHSCDKKLINQKFFPFTDSSKSDRFKRHSTLCTDFFKVNLYSQEGVPDFETAHDAMKLISHEMISNEMICNNNINNETETNGMVRIGTGMTVSGSKKGFPDFVIDIILEPDWTTLASQASISAIDRAWLPLDSQYVKTGNNLHFILLGKGLKKEKNKPDAPDSHFFLSALLIPVLGSICSSKDIHFIHSACVEKYFPDKKRVKKIMICGPKSSGKTTMSLCLEQEGFKILGDDITMISRSRISNDSEKNNQKHSFNITGINEPILLKNPDFLDFLNTEIHMGCIKRKTMKARQNICDYDSDIIILFPKISSEDKIKKIGPAEAFYRLMNSPADGMIEHFGACGAASYDHIKTKKESHLAALAAQCSSFLIPSGAWSVHNTPCSEKLAEIITSLNIN